MPLTTTLKSRSLEAPVDTRSWESLDREDRDWVWMTVLNDHRNMDTATWKTGQRTHFIARGGEGMVDQGAYDGAMYASF